MNFPYKSNRRKNVVLIISNLLFLTDVINYSIIVLAKRNKNKESQITKPVKHFVNTTHNTTLTWISVAAIALITYVVFSPSLDSGFTNWDDEVYVLNNHLVVNNSIPLGKIAETPVAGNYHPLTILSLALNYHDGKLNPSGYHLENVILHVFNTILVFFFIFLLTRRNLLMATIVSLFFGIHPMHVESVTWVSERKDVLYVFFFLAGLITYLRYRDTQKIVWYIFTFFLFVFSCLSKGMAVVFPVVLLLIDYLRGVKWERRLLIEKIPFFILSILSGIIAFKVQKTAVITLKTITFFQRLLFASYGAVMYIVKLFIPFKMSAFYPYPTENSNIIVHMVFYLSPFILLGIAGTLIYFFRKKEKEMVFGLLFYFATVVLVLQFISVGFAIMADRYSYLSYIGLLFVVAYITDKAWKNKRSILALMKYPLIIFLFIGVVIFSYRTYLRTQVWKNSETLWTDAINNYPDFSIPYYMRGLVYDDEAKKDLALADYTKAAELDSDLEDAYTNRGVLYMNSGAIDLALADFNKVLRLNPAKRDAYYNLGLIYANSGRADLAIPDFTKTIVLDSTYADAYNNRGLLYLNSGKINLSIADFNKAIALGPDSAFYYYNRGLYYNATNQYEKAADDFTAGIRLNPQNADIYYNMRGVANIGLQNYDAAIADFSKAIALNPASAGYWLNRAFAETKIGQSDNAKADELKGQQLQGK